MTHARILIGLGLVLAVVAIVATVFHKGETSGAAAVTVKAAKEHGAAVTDARADERAAGDVAASIAGSVARSDALTDTLVKTTIKDLRDALSAVPPAAAGEPLPAAPVDRLRDSLNAGIDRANRAGADAGAEP
jgi:hypothetical protein